MTASASVESEALQVRELESEPLDDVSETEILDQASPGLDKSLFSDTRLSTIALTSISTPQAAASPQTMATAALMGGEGQSGTSSGTIDELWNAIAPCWRRLADNETLPVDLTVSFAGNGMLAKPPTIERVPGVAPDMQSLRSESLAITALAECGVYQMAAGREGVAVHFPKP